MYQPRWFFCPRVYLVYSEYMFVRVPLKTISDITATNFFLVSSSKVMFLALTRSGMRLVKLFLGGQTVTLGKSSSEMERVSIVVETGLLDQLEKDSWIKSPAPMNPPMTTEIQRSLTRRLVVEI